MDERDQAERNAELTAQQCGQVVERSFEPQTVLSLHAAASSWIPVAEGHRLTN